jgi:hypothetical protein
MKYFAIYVTITGTNGVERVRERGLDFYWQYSLDSSKKQCAGDLNVCGVILLLHGCGFSVSLTDTYIIYIIKMLVIYINSVHKAPSFLFISYAPYYISFVDSFIIHTVHTYIHCI